jgi:hypothetical protein
MKRRRVAKPELSPDVAAIDRLRKAGASGNAAIGQRIALVAAERNLNPSEMKALLTGSRIPMQPFSQFCKKHNLSYDWVLAGDLKGLKRTAEWKTQELFSVATTPRCSSHNGRNTLGFTASLATPRCRSRSPSCGTFRPGLARINYSPEK